MRFLSLKNKPLYLLIVGVSLVFNQTLAQNAQQFFGKNRVQSRKFNWSLFSTKNFDIYYYDKGEELARNTAQYAEQSFAQVTDMIGYLPYTKTRVFVYQSDADRLQSNVGLADVDYIVGGKTTFIKSQMEVAFNGSQVEFRRDVTYQMARLFINDMMYGGSLRDMIQSTYLLNLPEWFTEGAARYVAYGWDMELDNYMRDLVVNRKLKKPSNVQSKEAALYGQSVWNYIAERYGKSNVSNILNLTRIIRNEEVSVSSTLAVSYEFFLKEWQYFYQSMADPGLDEIPLEKVISRAKDNHQIYNIRLSPDGRHVLYIINREGRYKVMTYHVIRKKRKVLYSGGTKLINQSPDFTSPVAAWKSSNEVVIIDHKGSSLVMLEKTLGSWGFQKRVFPGLTQVSSLHYSDDGSAAVMSAERNGQSDIFIYNDRRGTTFQLTNDVYDDLNPRFVPETRNAFTFVSNRPADSALNIPGQVTSQKDEFDVFLYHPDSSRNRFYKLTHAPGVERGAKVGSDLRVYYLSDENGVRSLADYNPEADVLEARTNYLFNIEEFDYIDELNLIAFTTLNRGKKKLIVEKEFRPSTDILDLKTRRQEIKDSSIGISTKKRNLISPLKLNSDVPVQNPNKRTIQKDPLDIDIYNYVFEIEKIEKPVTQKAKDPSATAAENSGLQGRRFSRTSPDQLKLAGPFAAWAKVGADNLTTTAQIDPLMGFGIFLDLGMSDMLGNHRFQGGLFGATDFRSSNMFLQYELLPYRFDLRARYEKKSLFVNNNLDIIQRYNLNRWEVSATYPFSASSRLSFAPFFTMTRFTNVFVTGLGNRDAIRHYSGYKLEYIYDKTVVNGLNMFEGSRAKIKLEQFYGFRTDLIDFGNLNIDVRKYQKVHQEIIFAGRAAYGQFFGEARKNYLFGGVDNWFFNRFEEGGIVTPSNRLSSIQDRSDLLFTQFATNMRGFNYNKLRGNQFLLFNLELRVPLVRYLYKGPITSGFFKNLQLVAFTDIGTAWTGISPFDRRNSFNSRIVQQGAFTADVLNYRNPFLQGQGFGVRTLVFGYYLKFDLAWGVEDFQVNRPAGYLSLGYDF
jgi:hypothetical protein